VIYEFGGPQLLVDTPEGPKDMTWVLPAAFGPEFLPTR
jgi:cytidine deaminase